MRIISIVSVLLFVAACNDSSTSPMMSGSDANASAAPVHETLDAATVARGGEIYRQHCAACHGDRAQGAPGWQRKGADGKFPPPPLDSSGHAWHHPKPALARAIREGTIARGGGMPAWGGRLSDADIDAVLAWIQSRWPAELHRQWLTMHEKPGAGHHHH